MGVLAEESSAPQPILPTDSTTTRAEKVDRHGENGSEERPNKRVHLYEDAATITEPIQVPEPIPAQTWRRGQAPIKAEFLLPIPPKTTTTSTSTYDDDAAEAAPRQDDRDNRTKGKRKEKNRGQNKARDFGSSRDLIQLCASRATSPEFSPLECPYGEDCRFEHNLRKYLSEGKRPDLETFGGVCPTWDLKGTCHLGWKCRFAKSHSTERSNDDGKKELILLEDASRKAIAQSKGLTEGEIGIHNLVTNESKRSLNRKKFDTPKADAYIEWLGKHAEERRERDKLSRDERSETRAQYIEPPFLPSEKRRIYYGPETPVLAPLTTQGNLPFRRLCVTLGAQVTWSEMALGLPLITGNKSDWALMKAHESETTPPKFSGTTSVVQGYDNTKDMKFGAQIAANKPWLAVKATEIVSTLCPRLRAIDLNCGCPIDLVYREGAGSALLDAPSKLENMLRGMNTVSGEVPITVKIRMGTKDNQPTAEKLLNRLVMGGHEEETPCGVAAITLHGRSRQQRYSRSANWQYISECAALIKRLKQEEHDAMDTEKQADARFQAPDGKVYFLGNGDCFSHVDYNNHIQEAGVDSVMIGRGALIKPWLFEEIEKGQYLDKSATERLSYIETFVKHGLESWGSDEMGVGLTRRFLLEWLSFSCRYVPLGILEHLPPSLQDRPPRYRGRNELETLLSSDNYKDWIKISEMFLGPAHPNFRFEPKHKSNSYEIEAEG